MCVAHIHTYIHTYTYIHIHTYPYIYIHTYPYISIHIHTYISIHTYTYISMYIHTYIHYNYLLTHWSKCVKQDQCVKTIHDRKPGCMKQWIVFHKILWLLFLFLFCLFLFVGGFFIPIWFMMTLSYDILHTISLFVQVPTLHCIRPSIHPLYISCNALNTWQKVSSSFM